jgi:heat shock protein 5
MARYSRDQRRRSSPTTSPWMTMFYICALVFAPMLLMGMLPSANAQEDAKETSVTGPGKLAIPVKSPFLENIQLTCLA